MPAHRFLLGLAAVSLLWGDECGHAFQCVWGYAAAGVAMPLGKVGELLNPAPVWRAGVDFSYAPRWRSYGHMGYARWYGWSWISPEGTRVEIPIHGFTGEVGLQRIGEWGAWRWGLSLFLVRAEPQGTSAAVATFRESGYFLPDNESEFGWHIQAESPGWSLGQWCFTGVLGFEEIWTSPRRTRFVWFGISGSRLWSS